MSKQSKLGVLQYTHYLMLHTHFRVDTRRTKTVPTFDFGVRMAAKFNKIAEEYCKKQLEEEAAHKSEDHSANSSKSNSTP